jgi:hypothetical protein
MNSMTRPRSASIDCRRPALADGEDREDKLLALLISNYQYHNNSYPVSGADMLDFTSASNAQVEDPVDSPSLGQLFQASHETLHMNGLP